MNVVQIGFAFLVGFGVVWVLRYVWRQNFGPAKIPCPHCKTAVQWDAVRCPHCTSELEPPSAEPSRGLTISTNQVGDTLLLCVLILVAVTAFFVLWAIFS